MHKGRMEAFSDGVIAIIITIMVLEIKVPHGSEFSNLIPLIPIVLSYLLSFIYLGIYWNNHHHMMQTIKKVTGAVLWANLHLLFWLSLIPFVTGWLGESHFAQKPMALYGFILLMSAIAYHILQVQLIKSHDADYVLAKVVGSDLKGKLSPVLYILGIAFSWLSTWISGGIFIFVALMWLIPDTRIEDAVKEQ